MDFAVALHSITAVIQEVALKMLDVKMTDQMTGHKIAGHEIAYWRDRAGYETDSETLTLLSNAHCTVFYSC